MQFSRHSASKNSANWFLLILSFLGFTGFSGCDTNLKISVASTPQILKLVSHKDLESLEGSGSEGDPIKFVVTDGVTNASIQLGVPEQLAAEDRWFECAPMLDFVAVEEAKFALVLNTTQKHVGENYQFTCNLPKALATDNAQVKLWFVGTVRDKNFGPTELTVTTNSQHVTGTGSKADPFVVRLVKGQDQSVFDFAAMDQDGDKLAIVCQSAPDWAIIDNDQKNVSIVPPDSATEGALDFTCEITDGLTATVDQAYFHLDITINSFTETKVQTTPKLSSIADFSTNMNTTSSAISFTITGDAGDLKCTSEYLTVVSSNPVVIANSGVTFSGTAPNCALTVAPVLDATGTSTLNLTVTSGSKQSFSTTFKVAVNETNSPPQISTIADQVTAEDTPITGISFTVDEGTASYEDKQALTITATTDNPGLVPITGVVINYSDNGTASASALTPTIDITPVADMYGTANITISVTDDGPGTLSASTAFSVQVTPVNDQPVIGTIANQSTSIDTAITAIAISLDEGGGSLEDGQSLSLAITSSNNAVINTATGISHNFVDNGTLDASLLTTLTMDLTPVAGAEGTTTISITVDDGESTNNTSVRTFVVNVIGPDGANTITGTSGADTLYGNYDGDTLIGGAGNDVLYADNERFEASTVAGLKVWFDAGYTETIIKDDNDLVMSWTSRVGAALKVSQTDATKRPTIGSGPGGYPEVIFDGVDDHLEGLFDRGQITGSNEGSYFAVYNIPASNDGLVFGWSGSEHRDSRFWLYPEFGDLRFDFGQATYSRISGSFTPYFNSYVITTGINKPSGSDLLAMNGAALVSGSLTQSMIGAANPGLFTMSRDPAADYGFTDHYLGVKISEILIYDTGLSATDQAKVEQYLSLKYGLVLSGHTMAPDTLQGDGGADTFVFTNASNSSVGGRSVINDFSQGDNDRIALLGFSPTLRVIGANSFSASGHAELNWTNDAGNAVVAIDFAGDGTADFEIVLQGVSHSALGINDFIFSDVIATAGADIIHGSDGPDRLSGSTDGDTITGGAGDDLIYPDSPPLSLLVGSKISARYDALDTVGDGSFVANSTSMSSWADISGAARHGSQITPANEPSFAANGYSGSLPAVFFDGADWMDLPVAVLPDYHKGAFAANVRGTQAYDMVLYFSDAASMDQAEYNGYKQHGPDILEIGLGLGSGNAFFHQNGTAGDAFGTLGVNSNTIAVGSFDLSIGTNGAGNLSVNGSLSSLSFTNPASGGHNVTIATIGSIHELGVYTGRKFNGYMGEVMVFSRSLTSTEIDDVSRYYSNKWLTNLAGTSYGGDILTGGSGADTFFFTQGTRSPAGASDHITDFTPGEGDVIDLTEFSGLTFHTGGGGLTDFVGNTRQLAYDNNGTDTTIYVDYDGDGIQELEIVLDNYIGSLTTSSVRVQ